MEGEVKGVIGDVATVEIVPLVSYNDYMTELAGNAIIKPLPPYLHYFLASLQVNSNRRGSNVGLVAIRGLQYHHGLTCSRTANHYKVSVSHRYNKNCS